MIGIELLIFLNWSGNNSCISRKCQNLIQLVLIWHILRFELQFFILFSFMQLFLPFISHPKAIHNEKLLLYYFAKSCHIFNPFNTIITYLEKWSIVTATGKINNPFSITNFPKQFCGVEWENYSDFYTFFISSYLWYWSKLIFCYIYSIPKFNHSFL